VFNAKGGEIKAKANGSANHLRILKIVVLEFDFVKILELQKISLLWGRIFYYGKKGEFLVLDQFFLGTSLDLPKLVCLT
jgi:hypothetical protein